MTSDKKEDITVVLLGKAGSGKSSTGNILEENEDVNSTSCESLILENRRKEKKHYKWHIFETPGISDIEQLNTAEGLNKTNDDMTRLMQHIEQRNLKGITTFLYVFNIHGRFGQEDKKVTEFYEKIFGKDAFWKRCIIVYTRGDSFEGDFDEWIREQTGEFAKLILMCDKRLVLISSRNVKSSRDRLETEIIKLINEQKPCYTLSDYTRNKQLRAWLVPQTEVYDFEKKIRQQIDYIKRQPPEFKSYKEKLEIVKEIYILQKQILNRDNRYGVQQTFLLELNSLLGNVVAEPKNSSCVIL